MIYFYDGNGNLLKAIPQQVYQGSNKANTLYFVAPLSGVVSVAFTLPNGNIVPKKAMTQLDTLPEILNAEGENYNIWSYTLPFEISKYSGVAKLQFYVHTGTEIVATQSVGFNIQSGVGNSVEGDAEIDPALEQQVASLIAWRNSLRFYFIDNYSGDFKDLNYGISYVRISYSAKNLPSFATSGDEVFVWVQYDNPRNQRITLWLQNNVAIMTYDYATQTWSAWGELDLFKLTGGVPIDAIESGVYARNSDGGVMGIGYNWGPSPYALLMRDENGKAQVKTPTDEDGADTIATVGYVKSKTSGVYEQITIPTSAWTDLKNSQPFFYQTTITLDSELSEDTVITLDNDNPVFFANFGLVLASISGQDLTIYATNIPVGDTTITLSLEG